MLKWKDYPEEENTWECEANLIDCKDVLEDFEIRWARQIIGVEKNNGQKYLLKFNSGDCREITKEDACGKWPQLISAFIEGCFAWQNSKQQLGEKFELQTITQSRSAPVKIVRKY